jgi:nucleotide-binding universal stress UspA family protein
MSSPRRILVPIDFSETSLEALRYARTLAQAFDSRVHLLHVLPHPVQWPTETEHRVLVELHQASRAEAELKLAALATEERLDPFATAIAAVTGDVDHAILSYAASARADLIVMGTHGHDAFADFLLRSVAERVVRQAPCPVLIVPHRACRQTVFMFDETARRTLRAASLRAARRTTSGAE